MNFKEAMILLINGKKITKRTWLDTDYIMLNDEGILIDENGNIYTEYIIPNEEWIEKK